MNKQLPLNTLINHITYTIDTIFQNYPQVLHEYLYLITYGMIINYGDDKIEHIYNTLTNTKFNLYNSNSYHLNTIDIKYSDLINNQFPSLEYLVLKLNNLLFISPSDKSHLKNQMNFLSNLLFKKNKSESTINKVYNILQSETIIKNIMAVSKKHITNHKFNNALKIVNNTDYKNYKLDGLDIIVNLFRPLYKLEETKNIINSTDTKNSIAQEFDKILGKNSYKKICQKTASLENLINNSNLNNYYLLSCEYVDLRNNFIKKYIDMKYA